MSNSLSFTKVFAKVFTKVLSRDAFTPGLISCYQNYYMTCSNGKLVACLELAKLAKLSRTYRSYAIHIEIDKSLISNPTWLGLMASRTLFLSNSNFQSFTEFPA